MKKFFACFFTFVFVMPMGGGAHAAISRSVPGVSNSDATTTTALVAGNSVSTRRVNSDDGNDNSGDASRAAVRRTVVRDTSQNNTENAESVAVASEKSTISRTAVRGNSTSFATAPSRASASTASRDATTASRAGAARGALSTGISSKDALSEAVHTVGRNARVSAASINNDPAVRRAGLTLRPTTAEVGGRAKIAGTDIQTGSNIGESVRSLQSRAATTTTQRETIAEAKERLEQTADLNKSCQEQYNDCMDQFCAVIDSNQKRCSCSSNLSRYTKVETAVKDANTQLNDVAQRIRYVGLSADEIRAIMSATEAEEALSGARDTTETRSMLDDIEALIKNPSSSTSAVGTDNFSTLDLNLDFSDTTDLFNLDFLNNNSSNLSNMRGADLYNAAKKRCNSILTQCKDAGATSQQITANYDLAIDKDCIAYEQGLNKMNETLVSNVRSANLMLQKARLAVLQNKNEYDAKGCIAALNTCMTDEMVCGENYEKCLDPTKKYIDENGNVILGQDISKIRDFMNSYDNTKIDTSFLQSAAQKSISDAGCEKSIAGNESSGDGWCAVKYLLQKIGTGVRTTDGGLCRAVMDKCQRYTYDDNKNYKPYNDIVLNYVQRAMVNIKSGQEKIISDYASNCMVDVATCYNQQVTQVNAWTTSASVSSIKNVMRGACRNVALTCGYAVFDSCSDTDCPTEPADIIEQVSNMFYQGMLCPENSTYTSVSRSSANQISVQSASKVRSSETVVVGDGICSGESVCKLTVTEFNTIRANLLTANPTSSSFASKVIRDLVVGSYVNEMCMCNSGYTVCGSSCVANCTGSKTLNKTTCLCETQSSDSDS